MTSLKHAEIICHMAKHGYSSVEGRRDSRFNFADANHDVNPFTATLWEWRIKPATITYTVTVPEPMRVMPTLGEPYWSINVTPTVYSDNWSDHIVDHNRFKAGTIWDTEAKAQAAFDAMFGPLRGMK